LHNSRKALEWSLLTLVVGSLALLAFYVYTIGQSDQQALSDVVFWACAIVCPLAIFSLWALDGNRKIILVALVVSAFVIASLPFFRFYFYGTDLVGEFFVADETAKLGRWEPQRSFGSRIWLDRYFYKGPDQVSHRYFATTSVTIVPAVISQILGLSTRLTMWVMIAVVSVLCLSLGYLIIKICFNHRVAALSCIVLVFSSFYLGKFPTVLREDIALLFLYLAIYCILKGGTKSLLFCVVALTLVPMSHYSMEYFTILVIVVLFTSRKLLENRHFVSILRRMRLTFSTDRAENAAITGHLVLYSAIVGFFWLLFVAYPIFVANLGGLAESFKAFLGLVPSRLSFFQQHVVASSLGPFHTVVQWIERIFALIGTVLAVRICRNGRAFSFVVTGASLLAMALAFAALPTLSLLFDLDRVMHVALLGFAFFTAITVFYISKRNNIGKIFSVMFLTLFLLETLQSPLLYSPTGKLGRDEYIFAFTHVTAFYEPSDFHFADWVQSYTNAGALFASDRRGYSLSLIAKRTCLEPRGANTSEIVSLLESDKTDYFLFLSYLPDYLGFASVSSNELQLNSTQLTELLSSNQLNRVYDNSRSVNFAYVRPGS